MTDLQSAFFQPHALIDLLLEPAVIRPHMSKKINSVLFVSVSFIALLDTQVSVPHWHGHGLSVEPSKPDGGNKHKASKNRLLISPPDSSQIPLQPQDVLPLITNEYGTRG